MPQPFFKRAVAFFLNSLNRNQKLQEFPCIFTQFFKIESHKIDTGNEKIRNLDIASRLFSDNLENNTGIGHEPQSLPVMRKRYLIVCGVEALKGKTHDR